MSYPGKTSYAGAFPVGKTSYAGGYEYMLPDMPLVLLLTAVVLLAVVDGVSGATTSMPSLVGGISLGHLVSN